MSDYSKPMTSSGGFGKGATPTGRCVVGEL